jgi:hypothetical protein
VNTEKNCAQYGKSLDHRTEEHVLKNNVFRDVSSRRVVKITDVSERVMSPFQDKRAAQEEVE